MKIKLDNYNVSIYIEHNYDITLTGEEPLTRKIIAIALLFCLLLISCDKNMPYEPSAWLWNKIDTQARTLHTIDDVKVFVAQFVPDENLALLEPTIYTAFENNFRGDCKTAVVMAEWACEQIGYNTMLIGLWVGEIKKSVGHQVVIAWIGENEYHLFTNKVILNNGKESYTYGLILSADWRTPVLEFFNNKYINIE